MTAPYNRPFIEAHLRRHPVDGLHMIYVEVPAWVAWLRKQHYQTFLYLHYWHWQRAAYHHARHWQQKVDFDVVHHVTYGSLQMGSRLGELGLPFVFGPIGGGQSAPQAFRAYMKRGWYVEKLRDFFSDSVLMNLYNTEATLRAADLVLTTNHETYERARQLGASSVKMALDSGLPPEFYPDTLPERTPGPTLRLLWVGSMIPRKGVLLLIDMMATLPDAVTLTLVGSGPQAELIQQRIAQLGLSQRVQCLGRVPYEQVRNHYASHDAFVFSSFRDSFGTQLLEAMAYGLPIITLDHQGAHTFVPEEAGIKVEPTDPSTTIAHMSQAIQHLLRFPDERAEMGRQAYAYALTQQWPHKVADMMREYESLLALSS